MKYQGILEKNVEVEADSEEEAREKMQALVDPTDWILWEKSPRVIITPLPAPRTETEDDGA